MQYATSYQHIHDAAWESQSLADQQRERAVDDAFMRIKFAAAYKTEREEVVSRLWDSGVPATNPDHAALIGKLASIPADDWTSSDPNVMRRTMRTVHSVICVAVDDRLLELAEREVSP